MKKIRIGIMLVACAVIFAACSNDDASGDSDDKMKDGHYQAMGEVDERGFSAIVTFHVTDGDVEDFEFNGYQMLKESSLSKKEMSEQGQYNLPEDAVAPWHEQVAEVEKFVNENNGFEDVEFNDDGKSDAISGATISYEDAEELFEEALENGPVTKGSLEDGYYFGTDVPDERGAVPQVAYVVDYGIIVGIHFDESFVKDGETKYKTQAAQSGEYTLPDDAVASYDEQMKTIDAYVLENQGFDVEVNEEGKTDAISGATITVSGYQKAFENATKK